MYSYIIDPQKISQKNFERVQNQLYSCVSELRISGEMTRVTSLRTVSQLVEIAIQRGATTIVGVGHDSTIQEIIQAVGDREVGIGYVPMEPSELSGVLGITDVPQACSNLAHRRVETLDLGQVHYQQFFTKVSFGNNLNSLERLSAFNISKFQETANLKPIPVKMEIDGQVNVEFEVALGLILNSRAEQGDDKIADPTDGILDILMLPGISAFDAWKYRTDLAAGCLEKIPGCAVMHGKRIIMNSPEGLPFYIGDKVAAKAPTVIEALPNKIRMVVGKDRTF